MDDSLRDMVNDYQIAVEAYTAIDAKAELVARAMVNDLGISGFNAKDPYKRITTVQLSTADFMGMARVAIDILSNQS